MILLERNKYSRLISIFTLNFNLCVCEQFLFLEEVDILNYVDDNTLVLV